MTFFNTAKTMATVALIANGAYATFIHPNPIQDMVNSVVIGLSIYAIWFACERTK